MKKNDLVVSVVSDRAGVVLWSDYNGIHKVYIFATDSFEYLKHREMKGFNPNILRSK